MSTSLYYTPLMIDECARDVRPPTDATTHQENVDAGIAYGARWRVGGNLFVF